MRTSMPQLWTSRNISYEKATGPTEMWKTPVRKALVYFKTTIVQLSLLWHKGVQQWDGRGGSRIYFILESNDCTQLLVMTNHKSVVMVVPSGDWWREGEHNSSPTGIGGTSTISSILRVILYEKISLTRVWWYCITDN